MERGTAHLFQPRVCPKEFFEYFHLDFFCKSKCLQFQNKNYEEEIKKDNTIIAEALILFSVVKKLERVGDLIKNVAEEIIFYIDAEVVKHKKKK